MAPVMTRARWTLAYTCVAAVVVIGVAAGVGVSRRRRIEQPARESRESSESDASAPPPSVPKLSVVDARRLAVLRSAAHVPSKLETVLEAWRDGGIGRGEPTPPRSLGFGVERRAFSALVSATSVSSPDAGRCAVALASRGEDVVEVLETCIWPYDSFEASRTSLLEALGPPFEVVEEPDPTHSERFQFWPRPHVRATARAGHSASERAALEEAREALGPPGAEPAADTPAIVADAFWVLSSPAFENRLGEMCGFVPFGLRAARTIAKSRRFDLLRAALRGLNPEGRYYAALALRDIGEATAADEAAIARLPGLASELLFCGADVAWSCPDRGRGRADAGEISFCASTDPDAGPLPEGLLWLETNGGLTLR
jgi:hypothetical protein